MLHFYLAKNKQMKLLFLILGFLNTSMALHAQNSWQQSVQYKMDINMDVTTNRFTGKQVLTYSNNSPDVLDQVFYHLYWNAFQPGSMMDERSRRQGAMLIGNKPDWDGRVKDRIQNLKPDEIGYQKIKSLKMNGVAQKFKMEETILQVHLSKPILPGQKVVFEMDFEAQVPLQIRRSGRDNPSTGVRYSMSQWYPKICAYDKDGWHPTPYVGREFYGPFGNFDVNITIDKSYILGGTGYLKNANEIGYGYESAGVKVPETKGNTKTWRFTAPKVIDFMWAADPHFIHKTKNIIDGITLHLLYKPTQTTDANGWEDILVQAEKAYPYMKKYFGAYPYKQYSFITGGDGGMEYPMATLLASPGAWLHEWFHSWYQGVLAINETQYSWMDEGFTAYGEDRVSAWLKNKNIDEAQKGNYTSYYSIVKSGFEEPLITHADHYNTNYAYGTASYSKGAIFVEQLGYILSADVRDKILLQFYNQWKFKHPTVYDFVRVAEKTSGIQLDWYQQYWINSTRTIDYAIDSLWEANGKTNIRLRNIGLMPMPIDFAVIAKSGIKEMHNIPLDLMYATKPKDVDAETKWITYPAWRWTVPTYTIQTDIKITDLKSLSIDPSQRLADINRKNNNINF